MERILIQRFILGIFFPLLLGVSSPLARAGTADQLTDEGHRYLNQGIPSKAFQIWEEAKQKYRKQGDSKGVKGVLINQAHAQQMLGQPMNACWSLIEVLSFDAAICRSRQEDDASVELERALEKLPPDPIYIAALQHLGISMRELWKFRQSVRVFERARLLAQQLDSTRLESDVRLSLVNTYQARLVALRERYELSDDNRLRASLLQETLNQGQQAFLELSALSRHPDQNIAMRAMINWLHLYQRLDSWIDNDGQFSQLKSLSEQFDPQVARVVRTITASDFSGLTPIEGVYARLKVAETVLQLNHTLQALLPDSDPVGIAQQFAQTSLNQSREIENKRAQANALVVLGTVYVETGENISALDSLTYAQNLAISITAPDLIYQASWQLAQLHQRRGQKGLALKAYRSAIAALNDVRGNLLSVNRSLQFSFRDQIEPLYRQYIQLLSDTEQPDFEQILEVNSSLQVLAIENYLQCGKLEFVPLKAQVNLPTTFYILDLGDRLVVLVRHEGKLHRYSVAAKPVRENVRTLQRLLQSDGFKTLNPSALLPYSQEIYNRIIRPGESFIGSDGRVIVVGNGTLNNLPLGLLHDGQQYLVEKYQIVSSLGAEIEGAHKQGRKQKALFAGITQMSPSTADLKLPPLPEVIREAEVFEANFKNSKLLIDQAFTTKQLQERLQNYTILHLATHAQFSSNPAETFLLTWDDRIGIPELEVLVRQRSTQDQGLDLLFLSACETAKGDQRSQLGLAGLATQAGARNAIASLWLVESDSTTKLASEFYQNVAKGESYARALQLAQLSLKNSEYSHPYYWAPFILLGGASS